MTAARATRIVGLSVGQRLLLGLAPALLALALVLGLAYYGEYGRQAPGFVVGGAALLAVISLGATWLNTRYLARRIRRLAGGVVTGAPDVESFEDDELGRIGMVVERLRVALTESEDERRQLLADGSQRLTEQSTMLAATVRDALVRLDEVRLPLHILLDAPFGELNENQEELIGTARMAADAIDEALRRLMFVADADRDALPVLLERVSVNDVLRGVLPMLRAAAERHDGRIDVDLDPSLPRVQADRARLAEALALLGIAGAAGCSAETALHLATSASGGSVQIAILPAVPASSALDPAVVLASRLLAVQGGRMEFGSASTVLHLPSERRPS
jgi:signal transduction histidine kinase